MARDAEARVPPLPKADRVYRILRQRIRDLELAPGTPLRKEELAAELRVSRAPVSEAIARLAAEDLVDVFPQHGSFVADIRAPTIREAMFIRMGLETQAVRQLAARAGAAQVADLEANIAAQTAALAEGDLGRFHELDEAMHDLIFQAADYPRTRSFLDSVRAQLDRLRRFLLPTAGRPQATLDEHRRIVEAIRMRDPEFAAAAMRAHLTAVGAIVEVQLAAIDGGVAAG